MAIKPFNSVAGFSVGETPANIILANGRITTNGADFTANITALGVLTDNLYYANGTPWDLSDPGGSNTAIQFNDDESFGGSTAFTFDKDTANLDLTGNITVSTGIITGDGGGISNISVSAGAFIENGTSNVQVDPSGPIRVSSAGTANILSVKSTGTAVEVTGSMSVSGGFDTNVDFNSTANLGPESNVTITGGSAGAFLATDGAGVLSWDTATLVPAQGANTQVIFNDGGSLYAGNTGFTFNKTTGNLDVPGNISSGGKVSGTTIGGSLVTNAQPNITSVGTLTGLILGGNLNTNSDLITNAGNITISGGSGTFIGDAGGLTNIPGANVSEVPLATLATTATTSTTTNSVAGANVSGEVDFAAVANSVAGANVSGAVALATDATTANAVAGANVSGAVALATSATSLAEFSSIFSALHSKLITGGASSSTIVIVCSLVWSEMALITDIGVITIFSSSSSEVSSRAVIVRFPVVSPAGMVIRGP